MLVLPSVSYNYNEGKVIEKLALVYFIIRKFAAGNFFSAHFAIPQ